MAREPKATVGCRVMGRRVRGKRGQGGRVQAQRLFWPGRWLPAEADLAFGVVRYRYRVRAAPNRAVSYLTEPPGGDAAPFCRAGSHGAGTVGARVPRRAHPAARSRWGSGRGAPGTVTPPPFAPPGLCTPNPGCAPHLNPAPRRGGSCEAAQLPPLGGAGLRGAAGGAEPRGGMLRGCGCSGQEGRTVSCAGVKRGRVWGPPATGWL